MRIPEFIRKWLSGKVSVSLYRVGKEEDSFYQLDVYFMDEFVARFKSHPWTYDCGHEQCNGTHQVI